MGRPGSALDNAVIEYWHSALEFGLRRIEHFATKAAARARVAAWIDDCNRQRRQSSLQVMTPVDHEQALQAGKAARDGPASPPPGISRCPVPSRSSLPGQDLRSGHQMAANGEAGQHDQSNRSVHAFRGTPGQLMSPVKERG